MHRGWLSKKQTPRTEHPASRGIRQQQIQLLLIIFIPLLLIELYFNYNQYQVQRHSVILSRAQTAHALSRSVSVFIEEQRRTNEALSFSFDGSHPLTPVQGNNILARFRRQNPVLISSRFLSPSGIILFADPPHLVGLDSSHEPFFQTVKAGTPWAVSDLRLSNVDRTTSSFSVATAVYNSQGQLYGVLVSGVHTAHFGEIIGIKIGQRGNFSIHDSQARSIYISTIPDEPFKQRLHRSRPIPDFIAGALQGQEILVPSWTSRVDGLERLGASVPIPDIGWTASVSEPVVDAMAPTIALITQRLLLFLGVSLMALIASLLYAQYLTNPLLEIKQAALDFGRGDLDRRAHISPNTTELVHLAQSFNHMATQVAHETRSRDAFFAQAAHELKTPLAAIKGYTQLLIRRQDPTPTPQLETMRKLEHQVQRMITLVERLLDLSRIQRHSLEYVKQPVDFQNLLAHCLDAARHITTPDRHPITFHAPSPPATPWTIYGDPVRLEQVLLNILENAIKYSPKGGPITVTLQTCPPGTLLIEPALHVAIQDTGLGLKPESLNHLFERYYRAQDDYSISGLGLGLYISHQICQQHGGHLWASSPGPHQGSTFHLALPLLSTPDHA